MHNLDIKAGDPESKHEGRSKITEDITIYSANAHMHKRGKSMLMTALLPDQSEEETVLWVPGGLAAQLTKHFDVVQREIVAGEVEQAVEQHRCVTARQHEPVAIRPLGVFRIVP